MPDETDLTLPPEFAAADANRPIPYVPTTNPDPAGPPARDGSSLRIGMRVRTAPMAPDGFGSKWAGLAGAVKSFPGANNVRIAFDSGGEVVCGPHDVIPDTLTAAAADIPRDASLVPTELVHDPAAEPDDRTLGGLPSNVGKKAPFDDAPTTERRVPALRPQTPTRERALGLARRLLDAPGHENPIGRSGCVELARRLVADHEELTALRLELQEQARGIDAAPAGSTLAGVTLDAAIIDFGRSLPHDGSAISALGRRQCVVALGLDPGQVGDVAQARRDRIAQARAWCIGVISDQRQRATPPDPS